MKLAFFKNSYRFFYNVIALITFFLTLWIHLSVPAWRLFQGNILTYSIGFLSLIPGLVIMYISIRKYLPFFIGLKSNQHETLLLDGIHRIVRHPLYLGTILVLIGLFFLFPYDTNLLAFSILILYTLIGIQLEERKLLKQFGDQYVSYQHDVPALIPSLRKKNGS